MSISLSRTQKGAGFFKPPTPDNLGPGSYTPIQRTVVEKYPLRSHSPSAAPFLSFKEREIFGDNANPGPGSYVEELGPVPRNIHDKRSGAFRSLAPRFAPNCPGANAFNYPSSYKTPGI